MAKVDERGLVELEHLARDLHMLLKRIDTRGDFMRNAGLQDHLHRVRPAIVIGALLYIKDRMAMPHRAFRAHFILLPLSHVQLESLWPRLKALTNDLDVADPYTAPLIPRALECDDDLSAVATHLRSLVALRYGGR